MPVDTKDFTDKLSSFNQLPKDEAKLFVSIIREPNETFLYLAFSTKAERTEHLTYFRIKKNLIEGRGYQFEEPLYEKPITGHLRETIANPANADALVKIVNEQNAVAFFRLNQAGVTVFKRVNKGDTSSLEESSFPEPMDAFTLPLQPLELTRRKAEESV